MSQAIPGSDGAMVAELSDLNLVVTKILSVAARLIGIAAFVMLIVAGIQYLTSTGDPKKAEQARTTLSAAIIGILIVIFGWFGLNILANLTGLDLLGNFTVCVTPNCR